MPKNWDAYYLHQPPFSHPAQVVAAYAHRLPAGLVLDLAGGTGRNAFFLARRGHPVILLERNRVALAFVQAEALRQGLPIWALEADLEAPDPSLPPGPFAGIIKSYFLHRPLLAHLAERLMPGGLVLLEGFTVQEAARRGSQAAHYWQGDELLHPPPGLHLRAWAEGWMEAHHRTWAVWEKPA
ncbi:class I SAM-dependent methyltransferase [Meiothermus sp. CFH 77666]|uniref:class I SAM-dependent methyltransferase n=1 Tax=Meiothermus sp. CFH 77666 TaxID=2817942 RepID=UPI001AA00ECA|nr:class I SAM-dependent methyltransferase [Meiothermus sp. CFH 77666]MBO1435724.1 class I SAM-dependent methyltransferase [Meiothermus sp. CFH 77666]